ncbi:purine-nucleoside phosphorylase [Gemella sp. GH3]|uniref:purine-nucleoside phosphorylase n=1 Tax=unclassified Gemella TaxID=2624949 RepID=UPI0015CF83D7|nr:MULTISPECIES: purine-nucleoside phosphorylase [unclassified Gemella]MBF0713169.1 purine-nucleoside phosphorylase [Gemella sp. GH3.1]NYS50121.1 purine-nucleoside phosphorylase [Gemella sp. GH3]
MTYYDKITEAANFINDFYGKDIDYAVVLGSGITLELENQKELSYSDIPNFPGNKSTSNVKGHANKLTFGQISGKTVMVLNGRLHYYEGHSMKDVAFMTYVVKFMNIKGLFITNACGAINTNYKEGDIVCLDDFISLVTDNPLIGVNDERLGERFVDMTTPFNPTLVESLSSSAKELNITLHHGTYGFFMGPYFETRAEIKAFKTMGCDLVGMSTVPEVIAANHAGLPVAVLSCVTNMATGIQEKNHDHEHVLKTAQQISINLKKLLNTTLKNLN